MDKKGIFGIILAVIGLVDWQFQQTQKMNAYKAEKAAWDADKAKAKAESKAKKSAGKTASESHPE